MAERPVLRFLFDYISPYAYLAWTQIHALAERAGADVEPEPVLFAAMLKHHGHLGPAEIPPKRRYIFKDVLRRAHAYGVPLNPPPSHPFNPLFALRATLAAPPPARRAVIDACFAQTWGDAAPRGIDTPEALSAALASAGVSLSPEAIVAPDVKRALRDRTDAAIADGAFGVPTILVGEELFWGTDSLPFLEAFLRGEDPVDEAQVTRWGELPVGQARSR